MNGYWYDDSTYGGYISLMEFAIYLALLDSPHDPIYYVLDVVMKYNVCML